MHTSGAKSIVDRGKNQGRSPEVGKMFDVFEEQPARKEASGAGIQ